MRRQNTARKNNHGGAKHSHSFNMKSHFVVGASLASDDTEGHVFDAPRKMILTTV